MRLLRQEWTTEEPGDTVSMLSIDLLQKDQAGIAY